jgi:hypothetical protein
MDVQQQNAKEEARRMRAALADELVLVLADDAPRESPPWWSYYYVVKYLGGEVARQLAHDAVDVEARGGMTTSDGSRKRSLGGIFFVLARKKLGPSRVNLLRQRVAFKTGIPVHPHATSKPAGHPPTAPPPAPSALVSAPVAPLRAAAPDVMIVRRRSPTA